MMNMVVTGLCEKANYDNIHNLVIGGGSKAYIIGVK
jgi:hypothetical protein